MHYSLEFTLAQLLGFVSFAIGLFAFYQKDDRNLKFMMVLLFVNQTVHFLLLDAITSAISSFINLVRTLIATKVKSLSVAIIFISINVALGIFFAESWVSFFPIVGASIGTFALFCLNGIKMRLALLLGSLLWLCNNIIVGSIGGVMLEIMAIIVNYHTISRLRNVNNR